MPLSDFKSIETGHYVLWTLHYKSFDSYSWDTSLVAVSKYDENLQGTRKRTIWHKTELDIAAVHSTLSKELQPFEPGSKVEIKKELCAFDGSSLHSLSGKVWDLDDVESCTKYLEESSSVRHVLQLFGRQPREMRPAWQQCLCVLTCLCCCDANWGLSRYVSQPNNQKA